MYIQKGSLIGRLEKGLRGELPGAEAQYKMAHAVRRHAVKAPVDARVAAVLALLYPKEGDWHVVFIQRRSDNPNDRHSGQISFPGGKYEQGDVNYEATALRETEEEVGVDQGKIEILGALTDLYIPVSNFQVFPYVGMTEETPEFELQLSEVSSILEVPFEQLTDPGIVGVKDFKIGSHLTLKGVPYFDVQEHVVWGATAMMLSELLEVWRGV
jgi:8-oxo-dGTP pyrophosphatase MutT (NUDIX family)